MSIIKLTDPRYCSPLDSPNTHLSGSKGPSLRGAFAFSRTLHGRTASYSSSPSLSLSLSLSEESLQRRERMETGTHRWSPRWFPLIFHGNTRPGLCHRQRVRITKLLSYQRNCSARVPCKALALPLSRASTLFHTWPARGSVWSPDADNRSIQKYRNVPSPRARPRTVPGAPPNYSNYLAHANFRNSGKQAESSRESLMLDDEVTRKVGRMWK